MNKIISPKVLENIKLLPNNIKIEFINDNTIKGFNILKNGVIGISILKDLKYSQNVEKTKLELNELLESKLEQILFNTYDLNRGTGRTTRLIDYYIQELYNNPNKEIEIIDHYDNIKAHIHLTQMILQRLYAEHPRDKFKIVSQNILEYVR